MFVARAYILHYGEGIEVRILHEITDLAGMWESDALKIEQVDIEIDQDKLKKNEFGLVHKVTYEWTRGDGPFGWVVRCIT